MIIVFIYIIFSLLLLIKYIAFTKNYIEKIGDDFTKNNNLGFRYYSKGDNELIKNNISDSGMDICANEEYIIKSGERKLISTDIYGIIPEGHDIIIKPRSGLAVKNGIDVLAGVVDEDYTGEIKVCLINLGQKDFQINVGDRIAQLVMRKVNQNKPIKIDEKTFITLKKCKDKQGRKNKGFGSSGK